MTNPNSRPLLFLATCLAFAETSLGTLAGITNADPTLVALFAMISLGMVLLSLVAMYFRDPAFLTFNSEQALDLRVLQELGERLPPELLSSYLINLKPQDIIRGQLSGVASSPQSSDEETQDVEKELEILDEALDSSEGSK